MLTLNGKRIQAFTKEETRCDAEVTIRKYPEIFNKARYPLPDKKAFNTLKGKIIKESDLLAQPKDVEDYLKERIIHGI